MTTQICNSPSCLIPKEFFDEEKIQEYWKVLYPKQSHESIGIDDLERFFLLYTKPQNVESVHDIHLMYNSLTDKCSDLEDAICINVYEEGFNVLVLKNRNIEFVGYFHFSVKEDILYHLVNISQHFFEDFYQVDLFYKQLSPSLMHLLNNYFIMKQL